GNLQQAAPTDRLHILLLWGLLTFSLPRQIMATEIIDLTRAYRAAAIHSAVDTSFKTSIPPHLARGVRGISHPQLALRAYGSFVQILSAGAAGEPRLTIHDGT